MVPTVHDNFTSDLTDQTVQTVMESPNCTEEHHLKTVSAYQIWHGYVPTIICSVGVIANILNITALSTIVRRSKLPVYRCFLALSVADFMVVTLKIIHSGTFFMDKDPDRMAMVTKPNSYHNLSLADNVAYFLVPQISNIFFAASNWSMVVMNIFRFIAVFSPLWYQRCCTTRIVDKIIICVYVFSVIVNIPGFLIVRHDNSLGKFDYNLRIMELAGFNLMMIPMVIIQVFPIVIITALLIPLLVKLCSHSAIERSASNAEYRGREKRQTSITLVAISLFFIICMIPNIIFLSLKYLTPKSESIIRDCEGDYKKNVTYNAAQVMIYINYTANFFFYILLNARLRRKLRVLLGCSNMTKNRSVVSHNPTVTASMRQSDGYNNHSLRGSNKKRHTHQNGTAAPDQKKRHISTEKQRIGRRHNNTKDYLSKTDNSTADLNGNIAEERMELLGKRKPTNGMRRPPSFSELSSGGPSTECVELEESRGQGDYSPRTSLLDLMEAELTVNTVQLAEIDTMSDLANVPAKQL